MANAMEEPWMDIDGDDMPDMLDGLEDILMMDFSGKQESSSGFKNQGLPTDNLEDTNLSEEILHKFFKDASTSFFNEFGIINHQINSFNDFITNGIHKLFDGLGEFHVDPAYNPSRKADDGWKRASIRFGKVTVESPTFCNEKGEIISLTPRQARLQNITYSSRVNVEVTVKVYTKRIMNSDKFKTGTGQYVTENVLSENKSDMLIGRIPIMVKSSLCCLHGTGKGDCPFDHGGYFLIKGMEKTFVAQEQRCLTRLWVSNSPNWMVTYYPPDESKRKRVYVKFAETPKVNGLSGGKVINLIFMYAPIPIWIMFFALGASSDKEIVEMIDLDISNGGLVNILLSAISDADQKCEGFRKSGKALEYLQGQLKSMKFPPEEPIEKCIENYLFPTLNGHKQKALFLAYLVKCLLLSYFGQKNCDNRDDIRNKRLELAGGLLERELRVHIRHAGRRMIRAVQRDLSGESPPLPIECYFDASIITNGLLRAFSTGGWSHPYKRTERLSGVVATLRRANPLQMMADMRKTRLQIQYTGKVGDARFPNPSYWGRLCFLSTPDGENCGLVKNLAVTGLVSTSLPEPSLDTLISCGMETLDKISPSSLSGREKVFLNGNWVGSCEDPYLFVQNLRNMRRRKLIHPQVEIKRDQQQREVRIFSDAGRILRPLLIVENNRLCLSSEKIRRFERGGYSFASLLEERILELIGTEEEEDCRVAWVVRDLYKESKNQPFVQYTHCELDQSFLLGLSCGLIPFPNHNNARRVLYEAEKHSQQAIGFNTLNPNVRVDTLSHRLYYPQKPLFKTMLSDCLGKPEFFNGQNAIVAVNVHHGFNQEDSLVMNRASLERGMFRTEHFRSYKADVESREMEVRKGYKPKDRVDFGKPQSGYGRVDSLEDDGFPFIGASMNSGDIVIGRVGESGANHGVKLKHTEKGMVQKVVVSSNDDGKNFAVVTLKQVRSPCLGDKFSSMHGQKGVVGLLESQENFPFTREGIVPDMVINPHAFPTRQTPGQLLETALGKGITCGGLVRYATPFTTPTAEVIMDQLHRHGFARCGRERVYDGRLGKSLRSMIFMGPTFYQRLVHMAEDKVKFRNTGPVHPLTRQPVADRKRYGGVKFGEMERDCMLAHGAAANLYERLFVLSDFSQMFICQKCCHVANVIQRLMSDGRKIRGPYCQFCKSADNIVRINVPYGAKLLYQELFSVGICLKFDTELC